MVLRFPVEVFFPLWKTSGSSRLCPQLRFGGCHREAYYGEYKDMSQVTTASFEAAPTPLNTS